MRALLIGIVLLLFSSGCIEKIENRSNPIKELTSMDNPIDVCKNKIQEQVSIEKEKSQYVISDTKILEFKEFNSVTDGSNLIQSYPIGFWTPINAEKWIKSRIKNEAFYIGIVRFEFKKPILEFGSVDRMFNFYLCDSQGNFVKEPRYKLPINIDMDIHYYVDWDKDDVMRFTYDDDLNDTVEVTFTVRNGSNNSQIVFEKTVNESHVKIEFKIPNFYYTYIINMRAYHRYYGEITHSWVKMKT